MNYIIQLGSWQSVFAVPADIVDKHMRLAGSAQLKTILFILRHSGEPFDAALIAEKIGIGEGDAQDAIEYWVNCGLIASVDGVVTPKPYAEQPVAKSVTVAVEQTVSEKAPMPATQSQNEGKKDSPTPRRREHIRYSYEECVNMVAQDEELAQMLRVLEGIMCKQLNHSEISVFVTLYKWYGMETSCVCMLVEYCRSIGKGTVGYIETTGEEWVREDVITVARADEKISRCRAVNSAWGHIRSLLDIPMRAPTNTEKQCSYQWVNEWKIDDDLIRLAYERCVDRKGKLSFPYMRGILEKWRNSGIVNSEQALAAEVERDVSAQRERSARTDNSGTYARTYDLDDIDGYFEDELPQDD